MLSDLQAVQVLLGQIVAEAVLLLERERVIGCWCIDTLGHIIVSLTRFIGLTVE